MSWILDTLKEHQYSLAEAEAFRNRVLQMEKEHKKLMQLTTSSQRKEFIFNC